MLSQPAWRSASASCSTGFSAVLRSGQSPRVLYAVIWTGCAAAVQYLPYAGASLLLQLLLLCATSRWLLHATATLSWIGAAVAVCITQLAVGTVSSLQILLLPAFHGEALFEGLRILTVCVLLLLIFSAFAGALHLLPAGSFERTRASLLLIPLLFFCVAETFLLSAVYGGAPWEVSAEMQEIHTGILLIQLFGLAALFCTLRAYRDAADAWENQAAIDTLSQAAHAQQIYVEEARSRYERTKSLRHDLKNPSAYPGQTALCRQAGGRAPVSFPSGGIRGRHFVFFLHGKSGS